MCAVRSEGSLCQDTGNAHIEVMRQQSGVHKETKKEWAKKWEECERENTGGKSFAAQAGLAFTKHLSKLRFSAFLDIGRVSDRGCLMIVGGRNMQLRAGFRHPPPMLFPFLYMVPLEVSLEGKHSNFYGFFFCFKKVISISLLFFPFQKIKKFFMACWILVPWPEAEPMPLAVEAWSLNHWIASEVPWVLFVTIAEPYLSFLIPALQSDCVGILFLPLARYVTLSKLLNSSGLQFPYQWNWDDSNL